MSKEKEAQQGKNIADAAKAVGLQHLIYSSVDNVTKGMHLHPSSHHVTSPRF